MAYYFKYFPKVEYDLRKRNKTVNLTDITLRFKVTEALRNRVAVYYDYIVKDGERPDVIAQKYYKDPSLSWIVLIVNDMIDPFYDWPLDTTSLNKYIASKYGSVSSAQTTVHHYERILRAASTYNDPLTGAQKIIPEVTVEVPLASYNALTPANRKIIYNYDYEVEKNDDKRNIKILEKDYLTQLLGEVKTVLQ